MVEFVETEKRQYTLSKIDENGNKEKVHVYNLIYGPGSNKYNVLFDYVQNMINTLGKECEDWYIGMLSDYKKNKDFEIIKNNLPKLIEYSDKYIDVLNVDFEGYIDQSKKSKNSIFFDSDEIKSIIRVSSYLKIYYTLYKDMSLEVSNRFNKQIFQELIKPLVDSPIIIKVHKIVSSKTFEYNQTDKYMWQYIKNMLCRAPDMHITNIFNFIVNYILVTCETTKNPIPYLISVIDESIKWILRTTYKDSIIYNDSIATQDVNSVVGRDNLKTYAHNNTIGHLCVMASSILESMFDEKDDKDEKIEQFKNNLEGLKEQSVIAECFAYPIWCKILDIPFRHLQTLSVSISYMMNILLYNIIKDTSFAENYPQLTRCLLYYNTQHPITKTSYKIKNLVKFNELFDNFLGFKNRSTVYKIYSLLIGKIIKNEYKSFITTHQIMNFPVNSIENEIIDFYSKYFSGKLEQELDILRSKVDTAF